MLSVNFDDSELSTFLRGLAAEYTPTESSATEPLDQSKSTPTASVSFSNDNKMASSTGIQFLATSKRSMRNHSKDSPMWLQGDFLAKIFRKPEEVLESKAPAAASGPSSSASFPRFCLQSCSWKTLRDSEPRDSHWSSVILPAWGTMRSGAVSALLMPSGLLALRRCITSETECGLGLHFPTPTAGSHSQQKSVGDHSPVRLSLVGMAQKGKWKDATRLPTVTVHGNYNRKGASAHSGDGLATALNRIPIRLATPMSGMGHGLDGGSNSRKALKARLSEEDYKSLLGGPLNPQWVEWFMGWPIGATDLQPLEMDKCHSAPQWHFGFWLENMRTNLRAAERLLQ